MLFRVLILCAGLFFLTECKKKKYRDSALIGHAGAGLSIANTPYHDNTAEAVDYGAQMQGISGVEVDIQCSKDGTAWLFHDPTIDLETDGTGCINSLNDSYIETLTYASLKREKLVKLKDLQFPYDTKNLYLDIRTLNHCSGGEIPQIKVIEALSAALANVPVEKINVIVLNKEWISAFSAKGWNVFYEATSAAEYINLEPVLLSKTIGTCVRNTAATKDEISQIKGLGKIVMLFDFRSPSSVRKALKKDADILSIDDLKGALIEKY